MRATRAIIDLNAISHNIAEIRKKIGSKRSLMAVVRPMVMDTAPSKSVRPPFEAGLTVWVSPCRKKVSNSEMPG